MAFNTKAFMERFTDRFGDDVDSHAIVRKLETKSVISPGVLYQIEHTDTGNGSLILYAHIRDNADLEALHTLCDVMIATTGHHKTKKLGQDMKNSLPPLPGTTEREKALTKQQPKPMTEVPTPRPVEPIIAPPLSTPTDFQPHDIFEKYKDQFLSYVDAHAIARKLARKDVISDHVSHRIMYGSRKDANAVLFHDLRSYSSLETLHKLCDVMTSMSGYPKINELGRTMKGDLPSMKHTGSPGSLDIDPKETSSSRYSETETSPLYVSKKFPKPGLKTEVEIPTPRPVQPITAPPLPTPTVPTPRPVEPIIAPPLSTPTVNHEEDLLRLCWIPFGLQTLTVDPESDDHTFLLQPNTGGCEKDDLIRLEIPKGAINKAVCEELSIRFGILVHGPFVLEDDYELVSMVVYIYLNPDHTTKPLMLHLPHWASKEETTTVVFAPHEAKGGYNFTKLNENILLPSTAMFYVPIYGHSTLFARAIKIKAQKAFFAIPVESQKETVTTLSVYFTFASQVWHDIIDEYLIDVDHQSQSPLPCDLDENEIIPRLEEDKGAGWEAKCTRTFKIISKHILYESNGIRNKKQLENAVCVSKSYPPYVQCEVKCTREAKMGGQTRRVPLAFRRRGESDGGLKITCTTYSQETIGGSKPDMGDNQPDGAIQVKKPTSTIPAPQPQEQQPIDQPLGSQPEPDPFRKVQARDVIALLNWKELVRDIRSMLTKSRVQTLKRSCGLINDTCAREIGQNLVGDPDSAATTLIEYFEENHSGSELMKFCGFLREEADQAGLASTLIDLAKKIEDAVKRTPSKGS